MKTIAFVNQKGGVAKTTSAVNVGACLAELGKKVLLIDLDAQSSLSTATDCEDIGAEDKTTYEVLKGADINSALYTSERGFDVLPTDIRLAGAEIELASVPGREFLLREALGNLKEKYDYILIDCPPSLGTLTIIGLTASNEVIIPVKADYYGLKGLTQLNQTIDIIKRRINPELSISGVVLTFFNERRKLDKQVRDAVEKYFPGKLYQSTIGTITALAEAPSNKSDVFAYDRKSKGAQQYEQLTKEIIEREEK